jgi:hypothetical protein
MKKDVEETCEEILECIMIYTSSIIDLNCKIQGRPKFTFII